MIHALSSSVHEARSKCRVILLAAFLWHWAKVKNKTLHFLMQSQPGPSILDLECKQNIYYSSLACQVCVIVTLVPVTLDPQHIRMSSASVRCLRDKAGISPTLRLSSIMSLGQLFICKQKLKKIKLLDLPCHEPFSIRRLGLDNIWLCLTSDPELDATLLLVLSSQG